MFAALFAVAAIAAAFAMCSEWNTPQVVQNIGIRPYLNDPLARRLLVIALINAMPVAVTSTLFLFFVEHRLAGPGWEGAFLLFFFLAAALSAPVWTKAAVTFGPKPALLTGMTMAIVAFTGAAFLEAGDLIPFAFICIASGIALGADLTLLPALFAEASAKISTEAAEGFGLWSFASKFSLAFAAVLFLPLLERAGFNPGTGDITATALSTLTLFYAIIPLGLKLIALALLAMTSLAPMAKPAILQGAHS